MAVEPAGPRRLGSGSLFGVSLLGGRGGAVGRPAPTSRQPVLGRTMPTPSGLGSAMPRRERPRPVVLGRSPSVASDREERASSTARSDVALAAVSRSHPGGHRSVIWPNTSPSGRGGDVALWQRPVVLRPRAKASSEAAASPCRPEVGVSPQLAVVAQPQAVGERPADPRLAVGTFAWALNRAKPPSCHQGGSFLTPNGDDFGQ
jgi:hypothetical protein